MASTAAAVVVDTTMVARAVGAMVVGPAAAAAVTEIPPAGGKQLFTKHIWSYPLEVFRCFIGIDRKQDKAQIS